MASNTSTTPITSSSSFPTQLPTREPSKLPSKAPSTAPSTSPSTSPTVSPTVTLTLTPTYSPTMIYTTKIGPNIHSTQKLLVNFTLNFSSTTQTNEYSVNNALNLAYSLVDVPSNYINNIIHFDSLTPYYFCRIFSSISAKDYSDAVHYEKRIGIDLDDTSSKFITYLKQILNANPHNFDVSILIMDIVAVDPSTDSNENTTSIIAWFLGVSAVCAVGALLLIICWKKFKDENENDNENDNAINLEFLLDPNATMHLDQNNVDEEDDGDKYIGRLNDDENLKAEEKEKEEDEEEEEEHEQEQEEEEQEQQIQFYEPPNLDRI